MLDDVVLNKVASIERCVARVREEYAEAGENFATDFTYQDAAILNIQRACQSALDLGNYLIRREKLGIPQSSRDIFDLLGHAGFIDSDLTAKLKNMVGFRNLAVHDYQSVLLPIVENIISQHLDELLQFATAIIWHESLIAGK